MRLIGCVTLLEKQRWTHKNSYTRMSSKLADQQEFINISSVQTHDIVWKTWQEQWRIRMDGERESGKSVLSAVWLDDYVFFLKIWTQNQKQGKAIANLRFGCVLWHINLCWLFNAKSCFYIYIKYIGFGLVGFYGISTIVGYLMPNLIYTYITNI